MGTLTKYTGIDWAIRKIAAPLIRKQVAETQKRSYSDALYSRLTADWGANNWSANAEIWSSLYTLRARSRSLERDNRYVRKWLDSQAANIIGADGFKLQMRIEDGAGKPDAGANDAVEVSWKEAGQCFTTDRMTMRQLKVMVLRRVQVDGESILRKRIARGEKYPARLEVIDADRLDQDYNGKLGANRIVMGVEIDESGTPVAYHLLNYLPTDPFLSMQAPGGRVRERVLADQIFHIFRKERPGQVRGTPWAASVMGALHNLNGFEEAAVIAMRVAASKMGFLRSDEGGQYEGATNPNGSSRMNVEPGGLEFIGTSHFESWDPSQPNENYPGFTKTQLRGIAGALGESYNLLANDLEGVNYSSLRGGVLDAREGYKMIQQWFAEEFVGPVFAWWLEISLMAGAITLANGSPLPMRKFEKFNAPQFDGRRWQWVDPLKEMQAIELGLKLKIMSHKGVLADLGEDMDDVFKDIEDSEETAETHNITLPIDEAIATQFANPEEDDTPSGTSETSTTSTKKPNTKKS